MLFVSSTSHTDASFHLTGSVLGNLLSLLCIKFGWETSVVQPLLSVIHRGSTVCFSGFCVSQFNYLSMIWDHTHLNSYIHHIYLQGKCNSSCILTIPHLDFDLNLPPLTWTLPIVLHWGFLLLDSFHSTSYTVINLTWSELSPCLNPIKAFYCL